MAKSKAMSDQLRDAVRQSELSRYAISKATGIDQSILARFVNDGAGMSLANIDKLCEILRVRITQATKTRPKG